MSAVPESHERPGAEIVRNLERWQLEEIALAAALFLHRGLQVIDRGKLRKLLNEAGLTSDLWKDSLP